MDSLQRGLINIIGSALSGRQNILPDDFDFNKAVQIAKKHQIVPIVYYGAIKCGISESEPLMQELFVLTCQYISVSEKQMYELNRIFDAFDNAKIDYMPLKGTLLKKMYPKPEMRPMGDADILIRYEQYNGEIIPLMQELGFKEGRVSDNELVWEKPYAYIELHRRLIPSYNTDYYSYYGDGWRLANVMSGTRYAMTDEDQMIYLFTHFAKHYRDAGIGIRHLVDIWVYREQHKNMDEKYIESQLKLLQIYDFYVNIIDTLEVWFADNQENSISDFITKIVFNSGVYGTEEAHALSDALKLSKKTGNKRKIKLKKLFSEIFPSYEYMCKRYNCLRGKEILLPIFWFVRLIDALIFRGKNIQQKRKQIEYINKNNVSGYQQSLNFVGLDFNFKE